MTRDPHQRDEELRLQSEERRQAAIRQNSIVMRIVSIIYYLTGALEILLLLRVLLRLFGANPENTFAQVIYSLSAPFVAPFANLFGPPNLDSGQTLEVNALVAMLVYALLAWLVARLVLIIGSRST
ncbi:MAG: YggT family protein [Cyanophyceae cyanobacterium]